jgi:type IV pilus assembly protein PilB
MDHTVLNEEYTVLEGFIPEPLRRKYAILPVAVEGERLRVIAPHDVPASVLSNLSFQLGKTLQLDVIDEERFQAIGGWSDTRVGAQERDDYPPTLGSKVEPPRSSVGVSGGSTQDRKLNQDGSVVQFVNAMIGEAIRERASDIHIEPYEQRLRIRYRIDGVLQEIHSPKPELARSLISRLKIMGDLDIAERRRPQDGRIRFADNSRSIDIRMSTLPTDFGEKIVLRILDKSHLELDLSKLGFEGEDLEQFKKILRIPYGMILVTGPTGSGKTTTLYAGLQEINDPSINITTIEDPIEYNLTGINQTHVKKDIGLTFAASLRSILRQDPNVIMVGEIRDGETAEIAIRAALTGHVVLSTLHTNDAPSALTRLVDMGIEPFLVGASVRMIIAQRLVRRLCSACAIGTHPSVSEQAELHLDPLAMIYRPKGCSACSGLGYRGRTAIYEILRVENGLADRIAKGMTTAELRAFAIEAGMKTLREAAVAKALRGETSLEEVLRETTLA